MNIRKGDIISTTPQETDDIEDNLIHESLLKLNEKD